MIYGGGLSTSCGSTASIYLLIAVSVFSNHKNPSGRGKATWVAVAALPICELAYIRGNFFLAGMSPEPFGFKLEMVRVSAAEFSGLNQAAAIDGFFCKLDCLLGCERIG